MDYIRHTNPVRSRREKWVADEHNKSFINLLKNWIDAQLTNSSNSVSNTLRWLAHGPHMIVSSYCEYSINGYYFYTKAHDDIQNGVTLVNLK